MAGIPNLFFSEYSEGSSNNKYLEIFNAGNETVSLDNIKIRGNSNGNPLSETFAFILGATIAAKDVYILANVNAPAPEITSVADETLNFVTSAYATSFNGDDVRELVYQNEDGTFTTLDIIGTLVGGDPGSGWAVAGGAGTTKDHTLVRKSSVTTGNAGNWTMSAGTNTEDSEWIVYPMNTWTYLGTHTMDGGAATGGDPHIFPLVGNAYELPNHACTYRMLQGNNLTCNMSTRAVAMTEEKEIRAYYEQSTGSPAPSNLVTSGVFYNKLFLSSEGHTFTYDYDTQSGTKDDDYYTISTTCEASTTEGLVCPNKNTIKVEYQHSEYGCMAFNLNHYSNPQLKHGMECKLKANKGLSGLLIRESNCKSMKCKLTSTLAIKQKKGVNVLRSTLICK